MVKAFPFLSSKKASLLSTCLKNKAFFALVLPLSLLLLPCLFTFVFVFTQWHETDDWNFDLTPNMRTRKWCIACPTCAAWAHWYTNRYHMNTWDFTLFAMKPTSTSVILPSRRNTLKAELTGRWNVMPWIYSCCLDCVCRHIFSIMMNWGNLCDVSIWEMIKSCANNEWKTGKFFFL